jgi:predicted dithiol-disulfide oxidoreductase (DUF899 family)
MGWTIPWYSSFGSDFNYDFHVTSDETVAPVDYNYQDAQTLQRKGQPYHLRGEQPGVSVFLRDNQGGVLHTYSAYARGLDMLDGTYVWLDLTPSAARKIGRTRRRVGHKPRHTDGFGTTISTARPQKRSKLVALRARSGRTSR